MSSSTNIAPQPGQRMLRALSAVAAPSATQTAHVLVFRSAGVKDPSTDAPPDFGQHRCMREN